MHRRHLGPVALWLALAAFPASAGAAAEPAPAATTAAMEAVKQAWEGFRAGHATRNDRIADLVADSTVRHYAFLRDAARFASAEQVDRLPSADRFVVYGLRSMREEVDLAALDGRDTYRLCVRSGLCSALVRHKGITLRPLLRVTLIWSDLAMGELAAPAEDHYRFGPSLVLERGRWRPRPEGFVNELSRLLDKEAGADGGEAKLMEHLLDHASGTEKRSTPVFSDHKRPLVDDAQARARLDRAWPDYGYRTRVHAAATRTLAGYGEARAQWIYGNLLYSGDQSAQVPHDPQSGLEMLEAASANGHAEAAMDVVRIRLATDAVDTAPTPEAIRDTLPHLQRAAQAGLPLAMALYGQFHADGTAGLEQNCTTGAQWMARAENAGFEAARNDRIWILATCPIADQRDPAAALALARPMIDRRDELEAAKLDTLAAAFAANEDFRQAVEYQREALTGLDDVDIPPEERKKMRARLTLYQSGRAYVEHEPAHPTDR
ncbi:SEL1-like repeat protein [Marilutibacter maris]|nr:sel1 repeat family protein [Lysobacter maris]